MRIELEDVGGQRVVNIKVIGIGGGGNNVINRMIKNNAADVDYIAVNTDKQQLRTLDATTKIQIGEKLTRGQGAGADPEVGRKSAEETRAELATALENTDMLFLTAGLGGGTGTGAAPVIADIAHEMGILTVAIVTKPFKFEGALRMEQAERGIEELYTRVDSLVVIPNENLKLVSEQRITLANAFAIADNVLQQAVQSIADLIKMPGLINLDFADVTAVMKNAGYAHMGVGFGEGKTKAEDSARMAIQSPLLESSINGAMGVLVNVTSSVDLCMEDVDVALSMVSDAAHPRANIILGAIYDEGMEDAMRLTVIATGFEKSPKSTASAPVETEKSAGTFSATTKREPVAQPMPNFGTPTPTASVAEPETPRADDFKPPFLAGMQSKSTSSTFTAAPETPVKVASSSGENNAEDADKFIKDIMNVFGNRGKQDND
ncbi:MAG: cell division protein FtsZ [Oscillospiraceae bacterium]|nr:cell division protein FtsZ [Oscillospiraceae bacterium]